MSEADSSGNYYKSRDLCFDELEFLKDSFDIDAFLREHKGKASLEMMRDDLGSYLKALRMSMIELINKDYEDFVNLSKDLVGLDNAIRTIRIPLGQLRDEILEVKKDLDETIANINNCLLQRKEVNERKRSLVHLAQVITSLDKLKCIIKIDCNEESLRSESYNLDIVERATMEYNQLQFSMFKCKNELVKNLREDSEKIGNVLMSVLNKLFLECFHRKQIEDLGRCLRIFAGLDKIKDAETLIQQKVVRPFLDGIISEKSLQNDNDRVVYDAVVRFVDSELMVLLALTTPGGKSPVVKGYNFMLNSFWPELEERLEKNLPTVLLSGNPEMFHSRFVNCKKLIGEIESRCGNKSAVVKLREHKKYQDFFHKWNLLVYFKMRFQEIAGSYEMTMNDEDVLHGGDKSKSFNGFHLKPAINVMKALEKCWTKDVYLSELAHMFWKLSLQILSRYAFWLKQTTDKEVKAFEKREMDFESSRNPSVNNVDFLVCLYSDTKRVSTESNAFLNKCKELIPNADSIDGELSSSLSESTESLDVYLSKITDLIVGIIVGESAVHLRQMSQIPRDFRRTNRESPTKPCEYVGSVLSLPRDFYNSKRESVPSEVLEKWLTTILNDITSKFYVRVNDVLKNDQKIEESIRKLKKVKDNYSHKNSDDDKIRQQLVIDIQSFYEGMNGISVNHADVTMLKDLLKLLKSLRDRSEKQ